MIVLDENIHARSLREAIERWYGGQVVSVTTLRPKTIIKDEAIPMLLRQLSQPTFVTINVLDFWKVVEPQSEFCIITVALPSEQLLDIPELLRQALRLPMFNTKAQRMGKVIRLTLPQLEYYNYSKQIYAIDWPK